MITKQNFCEVTLRLSTASESRTKTYDAPCTFAMLLSKISFSEKNKMKKVRFPKFLEKFNLKI